MRSALILVVVVAVAFSSARGESDAPVAPAVQDTSKKHVEWSFDLLASNNVVWRGFLSNKRATVQPSVALSVGALSLTSTSVLEFDGQYCWNEHDLQISYSKSLSRRFSVASGYTNYAYPALDEDRFAHEFFAVLSVEGNTGARFQAFQNVGLSSGTYFSAELSRIFLPTARFPIKATASLGYNRKLFIPEASFSDAVLTASTEIPVASGLTISPQIGYSRGLNRRYFDNYITGGLRFSYKPKTRSGAVR